MQGKDIAIAGGGPAGLAAAEVLAGLGHRVTVYDSMPTVARKFLLAGKSGLNITHSEDYGTFSRRFSHPDELRAALDSFTPDDVRVWAEGLGTQTFTGSSGRVFPVVMKASPLLRSWLARLDRLGVTIRTRHRWAGFSGLGSRFETPGGESVVRAEALLLAFGGASWPRLGSDAAWMAALRGKGVGVNDFCPANCGFEVAWSAVFKERFAGAPLKAVTATSQAGTVPGEFVIGRNGIEGSLVYAHASALRDRLETEGAAELLLDLAPGRTAERLSRDLAKQGPKASFSTRLRKGAGLDGVKAALIRELLSPDESRDAAGLAAAIKALPVPVLRPRPIAEAISSAGGVQWDSLDGNYMLKALPGVFAAGEMLDWEAPTGGYLLTACLATGRKAAQGMAAWLDQQA